MATTIEAISAAGQTSPATVYRLFGSKPGVLTALLDLAATGDEAPVALADRPHVRALLADPNPHRALRGFAALARDVVGRLAPLHRILLGAADSDPEAGALLTEANRQRRQGQARIPRAIAAAGHLQPGLTEAQAADIVHALMSPEVYQLLTGECGWSPRRYETWLAETLTAQLLGPPLDQG